MLDEIELDDLLASFHSKHLQYDVNTVSETIDQEDADVTSVIVHIRNTIDFLHLIKWFNLEADAHTEQGDIISMLQGEFAGIDIDYVSTDPFAAYKGIIFADNLPIDKSHYTVNIDHAAITDDDAITLLLANMLDRFHMMDIILRYRQCPYYGNEEELGYDLLSISVIGTSMSCITLSRDSLNNMVNATRV